MKLKFILFCMLSTSIGLAQVPSYVPVNGLKSYWPFNGNSNDESVNASHLTNNGAVLTTDRFGSTNSAYSVNGTNQYLIQSTPSFTFADTDDFTISVWVSKANTNAGVCLMNGSGASGNFIWLLQGGATTMSFGTNKQSQAWINISAPFNVSTWEHHVLVYQAGLMTYYKDNVVQGTNNFTHTNTSSTNLPLYVGRGIGGSYFNGSIDDFGVWDRALTTCEINDLYNASNTLLTVDAGPDTTVCINASYTLSGTGANTYVWDNGITDGLSFNPSTNQMYTVTGTDAAGCSAWDTVSISVHPLLIDAGADQTICDGSSVTLNGSGGTGYSWDNGVIDGSTFTPTTSQTYTLTGTDANGCLGTDQVQIDLYTPNIFGGPSNNICAGDSVTLTAIGGVSYVWDNNVVNGVAFLPTSNTTYTVVGTDIDGCSGTSTVTINIDPLPNINAGDDVTICAGETVTLSASGGLFYNWDNGVSNNTPFAPTMTTVYTVTGTNSNNCTNTDDVLVTVNQPTTSTLNITEVDQYVLNGITYDSSGTYTQTIQNSVGCDSVITLNLSLAFTGLFNQELNLLSIHPNPTSDLLQISINPEHIGGTILLLDMNGKKVIEFKLQSNINTINVSELPKGMYTCTFYLNDEVSKTLTFIKE